MKTCFSTDNPEALPILCTIVLHDEARLGPGTIWEFYAHRCHVESEAHFESMHEGLSLPAPPAQRGSELSGAPSHGHAKCDIHSFHYDRARWRHEKSAKGAGSVIMHGLLLALSLAFRYWLRTPHQLGARWNATNRHLEQLNAADD